MCTMRSAQRMALLALWLCWTAAFGATSAAGCQANSEGTRLCKAAKGSAGIGASRQERRPKQEDVRTSTVFPNVATRLFGYVEYNPFTCIGNSGAWSLTTPSRGTATTEIVSLELGNGDCPGILFPFNFVVYTWTDSDRVPPTDTFNGTWTSPNFVEQEQFDITVANVRIDAVNLSTGAVRVTLTGPADAQGTLESQFTGGSGTSPAQVTAQTFGPGAARLLVVRPELRRSSYDRLTVKWNATSPPIRGVYQPAQPWFVLGIVRYSQYNTPRESACSGATGTRWVVDSLDTCNFTEVQLNTQFANQVNVNGTGVSISNGILKTGRATAMRRRCQGSFPAGATTGNSYLQVPSVVGACNRTLTAGSSVAFHPSSGLRCRDPLLLVANDNTNFGNREAIDGCPACNTGFNGTEGHIDNYTDNDACTGNAVGDLGNYWTYRTN
jgi:hypothetical protein